MSVATPSWQTDLYLILPQPAESSILLLPSDNGWTLPYARLEQRLWSPEVWHVNRAMQQQLGLNSIVLRCAGASVDRDARQITLLYVLEQRDPDWTPPSGSRWVDRHALDDLALELEQHDALLAYFDDHDAALRPPWAQPGWFAVAEQWMHQQLDRLGYSLVEPLMQIKNWGISCILRGRSTRGDVYFKVASRRALFGDEPSVMVALAAEHPQYVPAPLAIDAEQGWMLLADVGPQLRQTPDAECWKTALRLHSRLQQSFVGRDEHLLAIGGLDRRLERLALQIDALLSNPAVLESMTDQDRRQVELHGARFGALCRELARYELPQTLVHGDLHGGNIALRDDRYLFFDWTDCCLAHPFFDLVTMLDEAEETFAAEPRADELRDVYLAEWSGYAPPERLLDIWAMAEPLGAMHQAISYFQIEESLEPASKHELAGSVAYWIRRALQALPAVP
jgi:hypothetical protein